MLSCHESYQCYMQRVDWKARHKHECKAWQAGSSPAPSAQQAGSSGVVLSGSSSSGSDGSRGLGVGGTDGGGDTVLLDIVGSMDDIGDKVRDLCHVLLNDFLLIKLLSTVALSTGSISRNNTYLKSV